MASSSSGGSPEIKIHNVYLSNVEEEFAKIRGFVEDYPYVAMDTEFPGVVATPLGTFRSKEDFNYQQVFCNVNMLKLIQVGFAMVNDKGELPPTGDVWQFNFNFSFSEDMFSHDSVEMLRQAGIDFNALQVRTRKRMTVILTAHFWFKFNNSFLQQEGIPTAVFGELLTTSGLITDPRITWLTFSSGYDFGYLLKSITLGDLPKEESTFFSCHKTLFPTSFDIKILLRTPNCASAKLKGGLQEVADQLDVKRQGIRHQAGSDALLTAATFFKIKKQFFGDNWNQIAPLICGHMFGLGSSLSLFHASGSSTRLGEDPTQGLSGIQQQVNA
ncbi:CRE-CCF-1 protein [Caenorhabditis remanei]|uniref:poly(A)-specific ribonuclease n=1 Tax=Caenorhabditis remanei TaxID=31234 RepID=E3MI37_CAERE|nr:CRE-CCF-1 protein [Caenorhabditis remanei]